MKTGHTCCPGCFCGLFVVFNPLLLFRLLLGDSSGYQPYWLWLLTFWGKSFSLGFGVPLKPRVHERPVSHTSASRYQRWSICASQALSVDQLQPGAGSAVGRHPCCSFWWAAASPVLACNLGALWLTHQGLYLGQLRKPGCCKVFVILFQASSFSESSCKGISGHNFKVKSSFESSFKGWSGIFFEGISNSEVYCGVISKGFSFCWTSGPAAKSSSKGSARPKSPEKGSSSKGSAEYPRCIDIRRIFRAWSAGSLTIITTWWSSSFPGFWWCQTERLWHLIGIRSPILIVHPDSRRFGLIGTLQIYLSRFLTFIIRPLTDVDNLTHMIILSHIERSQSNLEFLLVSTRVNRLPVDLVFVTQTRTVAGGKAAVLQALLGERNIARSVLPDDKLQVCSEIERVGGIPLNIKNQRKERWSGRTAWNIGDHLQFVEEWLGMVEPVISFISVHHVHSRQVE